MASLITTESREHALAAPAPAEKATGSILELANMLARHMLVLVGTPVLCVAVVVTWALATPKSYTTTVSFTPVAPELPAGGLASLAGQLGVGLSLGNASGSPDFYSDFIQTPQVLERIARTEFGIRKAGATVKGNIPTLYEIAEADSGRTYASAIKLLRDKVLDVSFGRQTSIVRVKVTTEWPDLSLAIGQEIVAIVNDYNIFSRQTNAGAQRDFYRQQLDTALRELRVAESALESFLTRNRSYQNDPALRFQFERLTRELNNRQGVFDGLTQGYEQARIAAVRNTPGVTLVELPRPALRYDPRHIVAKAIGGLVFGVFVAFLWTFALEYLEAVRASDPKAYRELRSRLRWNRRAAR